VVPERAGFGRRASGQDMGVQGQKQRTLIDQIMAGIAHHPHAVDPQAAGKFGCDDECI
jgi:hypothetical protein